MGIQQQKAEIREFVREPIDTPGMGRSGAAVSEPITYRFARQAEQLIIDGSLDEAYELLQNGIRAFPDYATGYQVLGDLYVRRGEDVSATFAYLESLKRNPDNSLTLMNLGDIFLRQRDEEQARRYYLEALKLDPGSATLNERIGNWQTGEQREEQPSFYTETAADLYFEQGHREKARQIYLHLLKNSPDNSRLQEKLQLCNG